MSSNGLQIAGARAPANISTKRPEPEARHHFRYPLRARAEFVWVGRDGVKRESRGHSRDISEGGAYVLAKTSPPMGAAIQLVVRFPYLSNPAHSRRIEIDGKVVRVEFLLANRSNWGFAVASAKPPLHECEINGVDLGQRRE